MAGGQPHDLCDLVERPLSVSFDRFDLLHRDGRRLVQEWAQRSQEIPKHREPESFFEAFIYLWFAVNGWGACIADTDTDRKWVDAVAADPRLAAEFRRLWSEDDEFRAVTRTFRQLWPIFRSSDLRRQGIRVSEQRTRDERVIAYLRGGLTNYQPSCWQQHDGVPPTDWRHTFKTIYRVRCNLFHGEKTLNSENDILIVRSAYDVLSNFVRVTGMIGGPAVQRGVAPDSALRAPQVNAGALGRTTSYVEDLA